MAISITVGGVDVTSGSGYQVELTSVRVTEDVLNDQWEFDFDLTIVNQAITRPRTNTEVVFTNGSGREFAGTLAVAKEVEIDPGIFRYQCIANNYQQWLDRHLVTEDYAAQDASALIRTMVTAYCPGFTTTHVQTAPQMPEQKVDYKTPSSVIRNLANLLSWQWYVDYEKDVHFFIAEQLPSPLPGNALNLDTDLANYGDWVFEEDGTQVKDRIIAKGFDVMATNPVPLYIACDGQNDTYHLPQTPAGTSQKYFGTITGGGAPFGGWYVAADVSGSMAGDAYKGDYTAYINVANATVRFDPLPPSGAVITGSMYYKYRPIYVEDDPTIIQQMRAREGSSSDGIYEYAIQDPRLSGDDTSLAQARAGYALAKYGSPNITATFTSYLQGWRAGQSFNVTSDARMDGELQNQYMYVAQVTKEIVTNPSGTPTLKYSLTVSDRPFIWGGT